MTDASNSEEEFFGSIGRLAVSWAQIELGLDCAVDIIHTYLDGKSISPKAPKLSLLRKTEYIRKWAKRTELLNVSQSVCSLMDEIEKSSGTRHDLIHGVIIKLEEESGEAEVVRLLHSAKGSEKKHFNISTIEILQAALDASRLGGRSLALGTELQDLIIAKIEERQKEIREL